MNKTFYYTIDKEENLFYLNVVEANFFKRNGHMADDIDEEDEAFSQNFHEQLAQHGLVRAMECVFEFSGTEQELHATLKKLPFLEWNEAFQTFIDRISGN